MIGATVVLALATLGAVGPAAASDVDQLDQLETARLTQAAQRLEFPLEGDESAFRFSFSDPDVTAVTDNAATLQQRVTKGTNVFLSTLAEPGQAQFLTVLKPCGILLPHVHPRSNEFYSVIFGIHEAGISQENGAIQDITFPVGPGQVFVAPQGLLHHNHNRECFANVFLQSFTSSDPGALNVIGALAAMRDGSDEGEEAMIASGAEFIEASPQGAFALDKACLKRCGFPATTGAPGDGLDTLPDDFKVLFGLGPAGMDDNKDGMYGKDDKGGKQY